MKKSTWVLIAFVIGIFGGGLLYRHLAQDIDSRGATRLMRALEENDADNLDKWLNEEEIAMQDKAGQTPLFYAAKHALQPQVIHKLLLAGADPFVQDRAGNTPLMVAARYNSEPLIVLTLARQGGSDTQQHNKNQALKLAARYNTAPVIKMLLMAQANPVGGRHEKSAAEFLEENERLTEREKNDLRQVMMLLEILQAREQFAAVSRRQGKGTLDLIADQEAGVVADTSQKPASQVKQMADEKAPADKV